MPFHTNTTPLQALSAGQNTSGHKHQLFDLGSGFKRDRCHDVTGEEQHLATAAGHGRQQSHTGGW